MDGGHDNTTVSMVVIYTPLARKPSESPSEHGLMHLLVPYTTTLVHAIESLVEFPDPGLFSWFGEPLGLLHELNFLVRKDAIEESSLDIELLSVPVSGSSDVQKDVE